MTDYPDWPDGEHALADFLAPLGTCGSETPKALQTTLPYIRIKRTGGASDRITDRGVYSVDVFAASADDAKQVAGQVRQKLLQELPASTGHGTLDWPTVNSAPAVVPATDGDNLRLAAASYTVSTRIAQ